MSPLCRLNSVLISVSNVEIFKIAKFSRTCIFFILPAKFFAQTVFPSSSSRHALRMANDKGFFSEIFWNFFYEKKTSGNTGTGGLPFLPGNTFTDPTKERFHVSNTLNFKNGYAQENIPKHPIGGGTIELSVIKPEGKQYKSIFF